MSTHVGNGLSVYDTMPLKSSFRCAIMCQKSESCAGFSYEGNMCALYRPACSSERVDHIMQLKSYSHDTSETGML